MLVGEQFIDVILLLVGSLRPLEVIRPWPCETRSIYARTDSVESESVLVFEDCENLVYRVTEEYMEVGLIGQAAEDLGCFDIQRVHHLLVEC